MPDGEDRTLTLLLEGEFTLLVVVLVLSSSPVLTTLDHTKYSSALDFSCARAVFKVAPPCR